MANSRTPFAAFALTFSFALGASGAPAPIQALESLRFKATGVVRSDMHWETRTQECYYVETPANWSCPWGNHRGGSSYPYLWQLDTSTAPPKPIAPPLGLRSA
ncbi:MAG: hypothetical protein NT154_26595, partial [Verrucomicrobia bacterium]|nr:hypothetical protein [Verrucomicrobiota bacterium]